MAIRIGYGYIIPVKEMNKVPYEVFDEMYEDGRIIDLQGKYFVGEAFRLGTTQYWAAQVDDLIEDAIGHKLDKYIEDIRKTLNLYIDMDDIYEGVYILNAD